MSRHEEFLRRFRRLEGHLRRLIEKEKASFSEMLQVAKRKNPIFRQYENTLRAIADMRNFLSHEEDGERLAIPTEHAITCLDRILTALESPPSVIPRFQREVVTVTSDDPIGKAVKLMYQNNFSQVPVLDEQDQVIDLLTTNTIARWLGAMVEEDIFSLQETKVRDVLKFCERDAEVWASLPRNASLFEVVQRFEETHQQGKRLVALLITHSGKRHEKLLGIITPWDLAALYQEIQT